MGNIPISIATALALDGLYNRHPELKPARKLPALMANIIYINARTLFRNIMGAIGDNDKAMSVSAKDYAVTLLKEMDEIRSHLSQEEHPLEVVYYFPTYHSLQKYMGNGELRPLSTEIQQKRNQLENDCLQYIFDQYKDQPNPPFMNVDVEIKAQTYQNIFIITHLPIDLLHLEHVAEVYLVESHTGKVKPKDLWFTKFATDRDPKIPFNKGTLLFFGDSGHLFKPQPIKARRRFLEVAEKRKWNAHTTKDRLMLGFQLEQEPFILKTLKELFK